MRCIGRRRRPSCESQIRGLDRCRSIFEASFIGVVVCGAVVYGSSEANPSFEVNVHVTHFRLSLFPTQRL